MGGLSKKASQLTSLRHELSAPVLTLDGGALLFKGERVSPDAAPQEKATARAIVEAYNLMGYEAVGVSRYDLAGGLGFLQELAGQARFAWLSANLVSRSDHRPLFKPSLLLAKGGLSLGVTGVTGRVSPSLLEETAVVLPWQETLPAVMNELEKKCDFIIILADAPAPQLAAMAAAFPRISLFIQAGENAGNLPPEASDRLRICRTANQGKYLGLTSIGWQDQPTRAAQPALNSRFIALETSFADDPAVANLLAKLQLQIGEIGREAAQADDATGKGPSAYAGWKKCGSCHQEQTKNWRKTPHARSWQTLESRQEHFNPGCLACHVTGAREQGADLLRLPAGLRAVGCETCHGPGREHANAPQGKSMILTPPAALCLDCHSPERDDSFDFAKDLLRAAHPE